MPAELQRGEQYPLYLPVRAIRAGRSALPHPSGAVEKDYDMQVRRGGSTRTFTDFEVFIEALRGGYDTANYGVITTKSASDGDALGGLRIGMSGGGTHLTVYGDNEADMAAVINAIDAELPPEEARATAFESQDATKASARLELQGMHGDVLCAAGELFADGYHSHAVLEAFKSLDVRVREMTGLSKSGVALMGEAFGAKLLIDVAVEDGQSGADEREGFLALFRGAMLAVRNPKSHEPAEAEDPEVAIEYLAFASLLHRRLDAAKVNPPTS